MKSDLFLRILIFYILIIIPFSFSNSFHNKKKILQEFLHLLEETTTDISETDIDTDYPDIYQNRTTHKVKSSSGLSTGAIVGIVIPSVVVLVGIGVVAALIGSSAPATTGAITVNPNAEVSIGKLNNPEAFQNHKSTSAINQ